MGVEIAHLAAPFMKPPDSFIEIVDDAGHFLHLEKPKMVNSLIVEFLT
jgi:pimeloyl-ACP methyl ester carboxylesterase